MKFVIGSKSQRKINVAEKIIRQLFNEKNIVIEGYDAESAWLIYFLLNMSAKLFLISCKPFFKFLKLKNHG